MARGGARRAERFRQRVISIEEAAHGGLGGVASALVAADTIAQCRHRAALRMTVRISHAANGEILVGLAPPALAGEAYPHIKDAPVA